LTEAELGVYDRTMPNNATTSAPVVADIEFALTVINDRLEEFSKRMADQGFPVISANLELGVVRVDAGSDPDDYSVLMAASEAAQAVGIHENDLLFAQIV